jgi:hypothetical protein
MLRSINFHGFTAISNAYRESVHLFIFQIFCSSQHEIRGKQLPIQCLALSCKHDTSEIKNNKLRLQPIPVVTRSKASNVSVRPNTRIVGSKPTCRIDVYGVSQEDRSIFREVIVSVILCKNVYTYMYPIPNGFRYTAVSLYSFKIVDNKEILRAVSITGIHCSSGKVGTVYLV